MLYTDYIFYKTKYYGEVIPSQSFKRFVMEASSIVDYITHNRINESSVNDDIQFATCEIADLLYEQNQLKSKQNDEKIKASETVGPRSVSYVNNSNLQAQRIMKSDELDNECYKICARRIKKKSLLYRGV